MAIKKVALDTVIYRPESYDMSGPGCYVELRFITSAEAVELALGMAKASGSSVSLFPVLEKGIEEIHGVRFNQKLIRTAEDLWNTPLCDLTLELLHVILSGAVPDGVEGGAVVEKKPKFPFDVDEMFSKLMELAHVDSKPDDES